MKLTFDQYTILRRIERGWDPRTARFSDQQQAFADLKELNLVNEDGTLGPWGHQYIADHDARVDALPSVRIPGLNA